jgi:alkylation response protein AidB-like acyl-CoA dehydrogenase
MGDDRDRMLTRLTREDIVAAAGRLADEVLFPSALQIDRASVIPDSYLDELAALGLYGLYGPRSAGGLDADPETAARVIEILAGASLTTTFVWIQHHSALRAVAAARPPLREHWLGALCTGRIRAGVASGALRRAGPPPLVAERVDGGWVFTGHAPWVTGWDRIGIIYVGARHGDDVVWALVDPRYGTTLRPRPLELAAVASSATVSVTFTGHVVPDHRIVGIEPYADWLERDRRGLRTNGYLAIGIAARCALLLTSTVLTAEVDQARSALDRAEGDEIFPARSAATLLAVRAATTLVVRGGGSSVNLHSHAQRLNREAMFLLVFGQTPDIRTEQLRSLLTPD